MSEKIIVNTQSASLPYADPFQTYLILRSYFGDRNVFLLESLSGPVKDKKSSFIGFLPLLTIEIKNNAVKFSGNSALIEKIANHTCKQGNLEKDVAGNYALTDKKNLWHFLRTIQQQFEVSATNPRDSFSFGFFGYFGYDTAWAIENLPSHIKSTSNIPDICLAIYQGALKFDIEKNLVEVIINQSPQALWDDFPYQKLGDLIGAQESQNPSAVPEQIPAPIKIEDSITQAEYLPKVNRALQHISVGDIYQIQVGHEITIRSEINPSVVYQRLRARNPSPYMYFAPLGGVTIIGSSPELFARVENQKLTVRPIAGTIKRGKNATEDATAKAKLCNDKKEIAEHIMLVDLARNDVGRICEKGTLQVDELMVVEQYSHVFHMVSNVTGQLAPDFDVYDVMAATFPAGTVTGAPKVRAMEIIEELETSRRGVYAGAIGLIDFNGYANTALCIRTIVYSDSHYCIRASGGIVLDSIPEKEWAETLMKMGATYWAITGEELS